MAESGSTPLQSDSTLKRTPCSENLTPFPELDSLLDDIRASVNRKIVIIRKLTIDRDNKVDLSVDLGVGICIDHNFVLTTARVVARIADVATAGDPALYKAYVGGIVAFRLDFEKAVHLTPMAVSFASDVAVLKVVEREGQDALPVVPVADSPPEKESILMAMSYVDEGWVVSLGNVRSVGQKTIKAEAPWPLDDELPWMEHDWMMFYRGPPPPNSVLFDCKEKVTGTVTNLNSSPWFNLYGEFVGIESWVLIDAPADLSVGYVVPLSNIWPVIDYAKTKGPGDRVVMDNWIDSEVLGIDRDNPTNSQVIGGDNQIDSKVIGGDNQIDSKVIGVDGDNPMNSQVIGGDNQIDSEVIGGDQEG